MAVVDDDDGEMGDPSPSGVQQTYNVFVGDLDLSVTEEDLTQAFLPLGEIDSVHLMRPRRTGDVRETRTFGFVHFATRAAQEKSLKPPWNTTLVRGIPCCTRVAEGSRASKRALYISHVSAAAPSDLAALSRALSSVFQIPVAELQPVHPTCFKVTFQTHVQSANAFRRYTQLPFFGESIQGIIAAISIPHPQQVLKN